MQNDAAAQDPTAGLPRPQDCPDLARLRAAIDELDGRLVRLLALRQAYVERAAQLKTDRGTIRDEARIEEVIGKVLGEARAAGLSPAIAEAVWRVLIERSIAHEFAAFDGGK
jgi:isochorismate pyruvate lyase